MPKEDKVSKGTKGGISSTPHKVFALDFSNGEVKGRFYCRAKPVAEDEIYLLPFVMDYLSPVAFPHRRKVAEIV